MGLHRAGMETVAFCEIEPYPQQVLKKNFPGVPIYDDVRTITAGRLAADGIDTIDLICGGFPCQPFSVAGKQQGKDDHRHLWPEMLRIIKECRPTWVIGENVAGFVSMALDEVCADLENTGYEVQPFVIPACAVDAPHRRDRVWIIANATRQLRHGSGSARHGRAKLANGCEDVADTTSEQNYRERGDNQLEWFPVGRDKQATFCNDWETDNNSVSRCSKTDVCDTNGTGRKEQHAATVANKPGQCARELVATGPDWTVEPPFCGVADGIPRRVDRLKCLGNAVVPQIPEIIGRAIMQTKLGA